MANHRPELKQDQRTVDNDNRDAAYFVNKLADIEPADGRSSYGKHSRKRCRASFDDFPAAMQRSVR